MTTHAYFKAEWLALDPELLERRIPVRDDLVQFDDIEALASTDAPGLDQAWIAWARGITVTDLGIPLRDWRAFLGTLRWQRARSSR